MPQTETPRRALVTGASTGLGQAIALALGREGYELAIADIEAGWLDETRNHPDLANRKVVPVALDLLSEQSIADGFAAALDGLGDIDLLVNNAGRTLHKPIVETGWDEYDAVMDVNLKGSFFLTREYGRYCIARERGGSVVNIASTHGLAALADRSVYGISKGALIHMARMLAIEWAERGIRVNAVAPATVMTPSREEMLKDPDKRERMLGRIPMGRFPSPEEIAGAVSYLGSPQAASITGQTIVVDGGLTAY